MAQQAIIPAFWGISNYVDALQVTLHSIYYTASVALQTSIVPSQPEPYTLVPPLHLSAPPQFDRDTRVCRGLINQYKIHFELCPQQFHFDRARVAYMISLIRGEALA